MLPEKKTDPKFKITDFHWLIYGQEKIGKSTFASQFPDILFIPTEPGVEALSIFKATEKPYIQSWKEFGEIVGEIKKANTESKLRFKMVAIDTVDNLYDYCLDHVCAKEGIRHPSEGSYGAGWAAVNNEFKRGILALANVCRIMFISHDTEKETEVQKIKIMRTQPTLTGKSGSFVKGFVDFIGYITNDPNDREKRVVYFRGHDALVAGDRTGRLEKMMEFDYESIKTHFEKGADNVSN